MRYWVICLLAAAVLLGTGGAGAAEQPGNGSDPTTLNILELPEWEVTASYYGGKLLFSDSPEMVNKDGIMYQDTVSGSARIFFHHVNDTKTPKRLVVLAENNGDQNAVITVSRYGIGGPAGDWSAVGKQAQVNYLANGSVYRLDVPSKGSSILYPGLGAKIVGPNMLVNGIIDFIADRPVKIKVMMMPTNVDVRSFARTAAVLPPDEQRLRGTFDGKDRLVVPQRVYDPEKDGAVVLTLADNAIDQYIEGIDATNGSKVVNYGNYGIVYHLFLPSTGNGKIAYFLNPRGGSYGGAVGVRHQHVEGPPVLTPANMTVFGDDKEMDFATIGDFPAGDSLWVKFSPPGASNLPVKLLIMPR